MTTETKKIIVEVRHEPNGFVWCVEGSKILDTSNAHPTREHALADASYRIGSTHYRNLDHDGYLLRIPKRLLRTR
jgi:hypothetical protein